MKIGNNTNFWLGALFIFLFDQGTKLWSLIYLPYEHEIVLNQYISLHRIFNEDTILLNYSLPFGITIETFRILWVTMALVLSIAIYWVVNQKSLRDSGWNGEFSKVGLFLILGSIWGNAFDRIFRNGVIDFIRLNNVFEDSIPILNIADIMIFVGEFCLLIGFVVVILGHISNVYIKKMNQ